jgi:hypothetical protein
VRINKALISLKMGGVGKSSLINHQVRSGFIKVFQYDSLAFRTLDAEVLRYIRYRREALITEDVGADQRNKMNLFVSDDFRSAFKPIFEYFVFIGTAGGGPSKFPAESVLLFEDALAPSTWKTFKKDDFYDYCWPKMVFSLRRHAKANFSSEDAAWFLHADEVKPKAQLSLRI